MSGALRLVRSAREHRAAELQSPLYLPLHISIISPAREHRAAQHPQPRERVVDEAEQSEVRRVAPLEHELDRLGPHLGACMACTAMLEQC